MKNKAIKRALITAWSLNEMGGAGLNCFELAEELRHQGIMSDFFTYQKRIGPLSKHIEELGYKIYTDRFNILKSEEEQNYLALDINDYDYLFLVENVVPISILRQLGSKIKKPKIITLYMSELVGYPTDTPLSTVLSEKIADLNLTISNKAKKDIMYRVLNEDVPIDLYRNPAPVEFSQIKRRSGYLKRIAVIHSAGTGDEIIQIQDELKAHNIQVDYIGQQFDNVKKVDAELYDYYDLIVGIGKNVQYSLVSGVPIYIYGRFGGPGYLSDELYKKIIDEGEADNFSGRKYGGFRSAREIANEIIFGYSDALDFHERNREKFIDEYSIDKVVRRIINKVDETKRRKAPLSQKDVNWLVSLQILIDLHWHDRESHAISINASKREISDLKRQLNAVTKKLNEFSSIRRSLHLLGANIKRRVVKELEPIKKRRKVVNQPSGVGKSEE